MESSLGAVLRHLDGPILITGHTGFKGTWLTVLLEKIGIPVVGLSLSPEKDSLYTRLNREGKIPEILGDIRERSIVDNVFKKYQPSAVVHLAAQPLVSESFIFPVETFDTNVMGTVNIMNAARDVSSVKALVMATTDKVYRNDEKGIRFIETDPLQGKDPYSASKVAAEAAIFAWQNMNRIDGIQKIVSVRAGNVIGGGDWSANRLIPDVVRGFSTSKEVEIRNPSSTRPWQHVLDPLRGYIQVLEHTLVNETFDSFNFGPLGKSLSVQEVAQIAAHHWGDGATYKFNEGNLVENRESGLLDLDSNRAATTLGWKPLWNQEDAVVSTVTWWKKVLLQKIDAKEAVDFDLEKLRLLI
jgi:CDP-glucose 4,6-dehydratase